MENWQQPVLTAVVGLMSAGIGAVIGKAWQRRRTSDRAVFMLLRQAFDRPAFRGPYIYQSDHAAFAEAIGMTLKAVETGKYLDRKGEVLGDLEGRYLGPFSIRDESRRKILEDVRDRLQRISHASRQIADGATGTTEESAKSIDIDRDAIVVGLNGIWRTLHITEMRVPTSIQLYDQVQDPNA